MICWQSGKREWERERVSIGRNRMWHPNFCPGGAFSLIRFGKPWQMVNVFSNLFRLFEDMKMLFSLRATNKSNGKCLLRMHKFNNKSRGLWIFFLSIVHKPSGHRSKWGFANSWKFIWNQYDGHIWRDFMRIQTSAAEKRFAWFLPSIFFPKRIKVSGAKLKWPLASCVLPLHFQNISKYHDNYWYIDYVKNDAIIFTFIVQWIQWR